MKRLIYAIAISFCALVAVAAGKESSARKVLDATANRIEQAGGITTAFEVTQLKDGQTVSSTTGTLHQLGKKLYWRTPEMQVWYDGKTQWSLIEGDTEVNMTEPTAEEQQSMNPYAFLRFYKRGFNYRLQRLVRRNGDLLGYRVTLTPQKKSTDIRDVTIETDPQYNLKKVDVRLTSNEAVNIAVMGLKLHQSFTDADFSFPKDKFPNHTIIDLR